MMVAMILAGSLFTSSSRAVDNYRRRFPLPEPVVGAGWGVNIHFTHPQPGEIEKIAAAGFKFVRMDFFWAGIEKKQGTYDFAAYDELESDLQKAGIRPIFILDYGNDLYEKGSPSTESARQAFCRFVEASIRHFQGKGILWEMWNEPNIGFWQPKPDAKAYADLAVAVGESIRKTAPAEWYIGPASSTFDWGFLGSVLNPTTLKLFDAVSIHPYRGGPPETVAQDWTKLASVIRSSGAPSGKPMISGEWGYSTRYAGIDAQLQAAYAVRQYFTNLASGIGLSIWYDWKNDGDSPTDTESNFGTVARDLSDKPAYKAMSEFAHRWKGYRVVEDLLTQGTVRIVLKKGRRTATLTGSGEELPAETSQS